MKKFIFGLIAVVMFGFVGNAQIKTDFFGNIKDLKLTNVTTEVMASKIKITILWEAGRWCFKDSPGCKGSLELKTAPTKNGKNELIWLNLEKGDFKMPNAKLFEPKSTDSDFYIFIPQQTLIYNDLTKTYEAVVEYYK